MAANESDPQHRGTYRYGALARNSDPLWLRPNASHPEALVELACVMLGTALKQADIYPAVYTEVGVRSFIVTFQRQGRPRKPNTTPHISLVAI